MKFLPCNNGLAAALASALLLSLAACGGGGDGPSASNAQAQAADSVGDSNENVLDASEPSGRAQALAATSGPAAGTLALASSNAAGNARGGWLCGVSADGSLVAFESPSSTVVAGDTNGSSDVFVKSVRTGAVKRVSTTASGAQMSGGAACLRMTPDGQSVLLRTASGLAVKNLATGALAQVTPPAGSVPQNTGFDGGSISDDGNKVVFATVPTQTYLGSYQWVNNVPARLMVKDLRTGSLTTLPTDNGNVAQGEVVFAAVSLSISPNGNKVAFVSSSSSLVAGDTNGQYDVFVRDLSTDATSLASSSSAGVPAVLTYCCNQFYYGVRFVSDSSVQFLADSPSSLGPRGDYVKNLATGALSLALDSVDGGDASVAADGNTVAFTRLYSGWDRRVFVRDLRTGHDRLVSTSAANVASNGNSNAPRISRDGGSVAFGSSASNLVSPAPPAGSFQVYVKTIAAPTSPGV